MATTLLFTNNTHQLSLFRYLLEQHDLSVTHESDRNELKKTLINNKHLAAFIDLPNPTVDDLLFWKELLEITPTPVLLLSSNLTDGDKILMRQKASTSLADPIVNYLKSLQLVKKHRLNEDLIILSPNTVFDIAGHCIHRNEECIVLSTTEFKILFLLATNYESFFTTEELMEHAELPGLSTVYVHIQNLRKKIESNPGAPAILMNYRGRGYTLQTIG